MNKSIVTDASVIAKWLLPDEENANANFLRKEFDQRDIAISVPAFIFYEVNNLLKSAALSGRIDNKTAISLYDVFLDFDFTVYWSKHLLEATLEKAFRLDISSYDAAYVALSEYLQVPFYTADEKLAKKAASRLIKLLDDY